MNRNGTEHGLKKIRLLLHEAVVVDGGDGRCCCLVKRAAGGDAAVSCELDVVVSGWLIGRVAKVLGCMYLSRYLFLQHQVVVLVEDGESTKVIPWGFNG